MTEAGSATGAGLFGETASLLGSGSARCIENGLRLAAVVKSEPLGGCSDRQVGLVPGGVEVRADLDVGLDRRIWVDVAGPVGIEGRGEDQRGAIGEFEHCVAGRDSIRR